MPVQVAHGRRAAVVAGHALAASAAIDVIRSGGNTVDAAVAGAAVLAVVLPHACTLGGDCFALVHIGGELYGLNGSGRSPAALPVQAKPEQLARGPLSCSTPGVVGAWEAMHRRFGAMPWADVLQRAIALAREGVPASHEFVAGTRDYLDELRHDPGCNALFLDGEKPYRSGAILRQPALAQRARSDLCRWRRRVLSRLDRPASLRDHRTARWGVGAFGSRGLRAALG